MHEAANRDKFEKLAKELETKDKEKYQELIGNLRALEYDDFANSRFVAPKHRMYHDFKSIGLDDIAEQIKNGEFDQ